MKVPLVLRKAGNMPTPPSTGVTVLQVNLITPESGEVVDSDCFRLDHTTGAFSSNASSAQSMLDGFWYAYIAPSRLSRPCSRLI